MRNSEEVRLELLAILGTDTVPVGARQISRTLQSKGYTVSESTVSRMLRQLDTEGLTLAIGAHGRTLSPEGHRRLSRKQTSIEVDRLIRQAVDVHTAGDLVDLLTARRAVEVESARSAALQFSPDGVARLRQLVAGHEAQLRAGDYSYQIAMDFHRAVAATSRNRVLIALTDVILGPQTDRLEALLNVIVDAHQAEMSAIEEHTAIVDAIEAGKEEAAARLMSDHLLHLVQEAQTYASEDKRELFQRLLAWSDAEFQRSFRREMS
jgi:DNA-binding FadR family transcriptional regulator